MSTNVSIKDTLIQPILLKSEVGLNKKWTTEEKKRWIVSLFFGAMMLFSVRTVMSVCALEISKEFNYDKKHMATLLSSFFYGYPLTQILSGFISDKVGGDLVIFYAGVIWGILTFLMPYVSIFSSNKYVILTYITMIRTLTGAFQGFHYPGTSSLVSKRVVETERAFTFSFITSGQHLGTLFCGIFGSIVLENYGWRYTFQMVGVLSLLWVYYFRYHVLLYEVRTESTVQKEKHFLLKETNQNSEKLTSVPWKNLLTKTSFWALIVAHVCQNNAYYILLTWLPTYFQENYPGSKGWVFNVVPWLISMPSTIFAGWLADNFINRKYSVTLVRKLTAGISLIGSGFFIMCISYTTNYYSSMFMMACTVACCGFHNAGIMVNPQDLAPRYAGSVFGVMNTIGALPGFIGVSFAGYILETTKSWAIVFNQTGILCFFGYIVYVIFGTGNQII